MVSLATTAGLPHSAALCGPAASPRAAAGAGEAASAGVPFGDGLLDEALVSSTSAADLSLVLSGLEPITPGHAVVLPRRIVPRTAELSDAELDDLWRTVRAASVEARRAGAAAANVALFDGRAAGQPVAHVHAHVVPRRPGDFAANDDVYGAIEAWRPWPHAAGASAAVEKLEVPLDSERRNRSPGEMAAEASTYREALAAMPGLELGDLPEKQMFAKISLDIGQLFFASATGLTVAFVNLRPLVPGHVLVVPRRPAAFLEELEDEELVDLFRSVRIVQKIIERHYGAAAANLGIQDGKGAGQSVPHVHVHILPRRDDS